MHPFFFIKIIFRPLRINLQFWWKIFANLVWLFGFQKKLTMSGKNWPPKLLLLKLSIFEKKNIFSSQMLMIIKKNEIYIRSYFYSNGNMARSRLLPIFGVDCQTSATWKPNIGNPKIGPRYRQTDGKSYQLIREFRNMFLKTEDSNFNPIFFKLGLYFIFNPNIGNILRRNRCIRICGKEAR